jgi:benzoate membrane transport protein
MSAFVALLVVVGVAAAGHGAIHGPLRPRLSATSPRLRPAATVGLALPLYAVTMAGQNVPGVAIMRSFGYEIPWREALGLTGLLTTYLSAAPARVVATIAALGLLPTLGASLRAAFARDADRVGGGITLVVAASGVTIAGLPAPAWALAAGLVARGALRHGVQRGPV